MEPTLSSETSAFKLQTPGKFLKEHRLQYVCWLGTEQIATVLWIVQDTLQGQFQKRMSLKHQHYNCSACAFTWIRTLTVIKERQEKRRSQSDFGQKSCTVQNEGIIHKRKCWRRTDNNKHQTPNTSRQKGAARTFWMYVWNCNVKVAALRVCIEGWNITEKRNENGRILVLVTGIGREINP